MSIAQQPDRAVLPSETVLARLRQLHPRAIDLRLHRVERLLAKMGHPERALPPVFHIAGTNGKGSTIAFMRACLEQAGYRVHVYTSPHLVRFNERIRLAGELIDDAHLQDVLEALERTNNDDPVTEFEVVTAAAFQAFCEVPADIVLLETGLGGIYDATNVIARPALTAITTVSMDHPQFLGNTVDEIAISKAGILKPGVTGVVGRQTPSVQVMMEAHARAIGADLVCRDKDWQAERLDDRLEYREAGRQVDLPLPNLRGAHQTDNAGLAIACLGRLNGFNVPDAAISRGLRRADWPGRLQQLKRGPLIDLLPAGSDCWLDGGHNVAAGEVLADTVARWRTREAQRRPLQVIFSMQPTKDPAGFLAPFQGLGITVHAVPIPDDAASFDIEAAAAEARKLGFEAHAAASAGAAAAAIARSYNGSAMPPRVLICGSLYLAGAILAENG